MKTQLITFITICLCYLYSTTAQATLISVVPQSAEITQGQQVVVDIVISELGNGNATSISTFDLFLNFDADLFSISHVNFGEQLNLLGFGSIQMLNPINIGMLNISEISFDDFATLDALQPGSFTLASVTFDSLAGGVSSLTTTINRLGDSVGNALTSRTANSSVMVTSVSEPSMLLLILIGFVSLCTKRQKY